MILVVGDGTLGVCPAKVTDAQGQEHLALSITKYDTPFVVGQRIPKDEVRAIFDNSKDLLLLCENLAGVRVLQDAINTIALKLQELLYQPPLPPKEKTKRTKSKVVVNPSVKGSRKVG